SVSTVSGLPSFPVGSVRYHLLASMISAGNRTARATAAPSPSRSPFSPSPSSSAGASEVGGGASVVGSGSRGGSGSGSSAVGSTERSREARLTSSSAGGPSAPANDSTLPRTA